MENHDLETIELSIEHAKKAIALKTSVERLTRNRDFKAVFTEGYFEKEAQRLVFLKADPSMQDEADQKEIIKQIDAIGVLRQYLSTQMHLGRMAEKALEEDERTREELLAEEGAAE
jgi:DNA-binding transcriptional regulator YhcF (GntR family)